MTLLAPQRVEAVERCLRGEDTAAKDLERMLAADAYGSFASFVQQCWHIHDPGRKLEWEWYLDLLCRELEMVTRGETRDLLICIPPGFAKSLIVSVLWPAWWWLRDPKQRFLTLSGGEPLSIKDNRRMREVIKSDWYQRLMLHVEEQHGIPRWGFAKDQDQKRYFENTARGHRQCFGVDGSPTGNRGDGMIIDDPHQVKEVLGDFANVEATLEKAWTRCNAILATRVYDRRVSWTVTIMQRLHLLDVAGRKLARAKGRGRVGKKLRTVILPMRYEPTDEDNHPEDPRTEPGELLAPDRMPQDEVDELAAELDEVPGQASAQLDQRPVPSTGGLIKESWCQQRYDFDPQRPDTRFPLVAVTVDATFKKTKKGSFVSIQAWGVRNTQRYLLGEIHARMDYVEQKQSLRDFCTTWSPNVVLIEEKANGAALVRDLRDEIQGIVAVTMDRYGDKMARAQLATPAWAAGNVWLPLPQWMQSIGAWIAEIRAFPFGANDRMDSMSQLFLWLADNVALTQDTEKMIQALEGVLAALDDL